jgi:hypothetical protein
LQLIIWDAIFLNYSKERNSSVRGQLRHYAASQKVMGLIPDEISGLFY